VAQRFELSVDVSYVDQSIARDKKLIKGIIDGTES